MPGSAPFRLNRNGMLVALISAGFAGQAAAAAGRVDFTTAGVTIAGRDGQARPLAKGTELDSGDTIRTNNEGRAQIRFTDGSYVSLQPNTDFAISEYKFEGKDDDRGFFGLVKGAMRTVTGAVGRVNRNSYRITTPTATVGIRGTGGRIEVLLDGSTLIAGTSGIWTLTNPSGTLDIPAGRFGRAPAAPDQPPRQVNQGPNTGPAPLPVDPPKPVFQKGEDVKPDGTTAAVPPTPPIVPLVSGPGYAASAAFLSGSAGLQSDGNANAVFDAAGRLMEVNFSDGQNFKMNGSHAEFGTDGILAWGRWTGNVTGEYMCDGLCTFNQTYDINRGFHYVIGTPTPVMPTTGSASYSLFSVNGQLSASRPTYTDGSFAPGTLLSSSKVGITFGATHSINVKLDMTMGDGRSLFVNASGTSMTSSFSLSAVSGTGSGCSSGCTGSVQGFFAGATAERAGVGYRIQEVSGLYKTVVGAAAFKKD
jgi:FecR protein